MSVLMRPTPTPVASDPLPSGTISGGAGGDANRDTVAVRPSAARPVAETLREWFGVDFNVLDVASGHLVYRAAEQPCGDWDLRTELARQVASRRTAEVIAEEEPLAVVAIPRPGRHGQDMVAVATFVTRPLGAHDDLARAAALLGLDLEAARHWIDRQPIWAVKPLLTMSRMAAERLIAEDRVIELRQEVASLSANIAATYEEISLLHRVTHNLRISEDDEQLTRLALEWLAETVPARGLAAVLTPVANAQQHVHTTRRTQPVLVSHGDMPLALDELTELIESLNLAQQSRPVVMNRPVTERPGWRFPDLHELIVVTLSDGETVFGYLAALNHAKGGEFGTIEANLLASLGSILGVHAANIDLYRRRAELLTGIVRALTSAIEAKDPYTCGHSDRVARVAVRLSKELGLDPQTQSTVYLSGLLHDVGKIGIDDTVLRKPGQLTPAEFEHIKLHPELGYKILVDLAELDQVLPVVLHHHENWNGAGYPHRLAGEDIPLLARIVAVADAFDAMGSDRPYRKGMPDDKVDGILRGGGGTQWDPRVVAAFFQARDDIRDIARREREALAIDAQQWL
jgi:HD-GYP domain-containing protein (c-di-GMP phosphodiesterase class II)